MNTSPTRQTISVSEADYKQWLKNQPWNRPGYNARKMQEHAEAGRLMCAAPVGYKNAFVGDEKAVVLDPVMAPVVKEAFILAATGKYSLRKLIALLTPKGLSSRDGKPLQAETLRGILTNPFYLGYVRFDGKLTPGRHEALVDRTTFEKVQKGLAKRRKSRASALG